MVDYENLRTTVVKGLRKHLGCPVIRNNQNAEPPPYPYVSYTVTMLMSENKGTFGEYEDGCARRPVTTIWSITAQSDDNIESVMLANKAHNWLDYAGTLYLNDNNVIVQSVGSVTNRDNVLSVGYEYKNGFDCVFWMFDEVEIPEVETIEIMEFGDDWNKRLENTLDGIKQSSYGFAQAYGDEADALSAILEKRINGVE